MYMSLGSFNAHGAIIILISCRACIAGSCIRLHLNRGVPPF